MQALRARGTDARLVVFNRYGLHPEADIDLERHGGLLRQQLTQWRAFARLAPRTDIFHFYFGLTLVPKSLQFPILRATRKKSVFHFLGSDIRGKTRGELAYGHRADAQIVGSYDAARWVPEAFVVPPGLDLRSYQPRPPSDNPRPLVVHAPSNRAKKGTQSVIDACAQLSVDLDLVEGVPHDEARERYARADIVIDQLEVGWHGVFAIEAMAFGKPVIGHVKPDVVERSAEAFGVRLPIVPATKETLVDALRLLIDDPQLRRELGATGRAYVEQVHDIDRVADRLLAVYRQL